MKSDYENTVLKVQEEKFEAWIDRARKEARKIAKRKGHVCSDDIWRVCPPPEYADPRVMGTVFHPSDDWVITHYQRSARKECHGRPVAVRQLAPHAA